MTTINLFTVDQQLAILTKPTLAAGDQESDILHVDFSTEWDGYAKSAVFFTSLNKTPYEIPLTSGECKIPQEVLGNKCVLYIGVRGVKSNGEVKTSSLVKYNLKDGAPAGEGTAVAPTASVYQQLLAAYGKTDAEIAKETSERKKADDLLSARMDTFTALKEGSTTGDAELMDIRVGADGVNYGSAGAAVRGQVQNINNSISAVMQKNHCDNPFQPLLFDQYKYYFGTSSGTTMDVMGIPRYTVGDFEEYKQAFTEVSGSSHGFCARFVEPIPVFENPDGEYILIVKSGKRFQNNLQISFSSDASWNTEACTICVCDIRISQGYNVIPLMSKTFTDNGHDKYKYLCVNAGSMMLSDACFFDLYLVKGDSLAQWVNYQAHSDSRFLTPDKSRFTVSANNVNPTITINGAKIKADIPADSSEEAIWRYALIGYNLGKDISGRKIVIRSNSLNITPVFGIGKSQSAWRNKGFNVGNGEIELIDVEKFISDNETLSTHTGDFYVTLGIDFGTKTEINATSIEFEIMLVNELDVIDPYSELFGVSPNEFEKSSGNYITCWGDSLTAGGGWTDILSNLSGMTVYNAGTGGESAATIISRQGADVMIVDNLTIPEDTTEVQVASRETDGGISTEFGKTVTPLLQGGTSHVNPVMIGDIEGTLAWTGSSYSDTTGAWTFTRLTAGDAVTVNRPTAIRTAFDREKNSPYLMVIFIGQNGGYSTISELVNMHKLMINHANAKNVIVLGLSSGSAESRNDYETAMRNEFGRYFISLREYLSKYGLDDAGLTATEDDTAAMEAGKVPPQLLSDSVHYTPACKTVIGNMLYKKCCELNIFPCN